MFYNFPLQQYLSSSSFDSLIDQVGNQVQHEPFPPTSTELNLSHFTSLQEQKNAQDSYEEDSFKFTPSKLKPKPGELIRERIVYQPPDSESIAAAANVATNNRGKRRNRTKFEKNQVNLFHI